MRAVELSKGVGVGALVSRLVDWRIRRRMKWRYVSIPCCSDNWNNGARRREVKNPSATTKQTNRTCKGGLTERISC